MIHKKAFSILIGSLILASSCVENERDLSIKIDKDEYFDFNINQKVSLDINYSFNNENYIILFELYDQNPLIAGEDDTMQKIEGLEPLYRAATNGSGKFTGNIEIQSALSEVWLYSDYLGTISPIKLNVKDGKISFNQADYINEIRQNSGNTRAVIPGSQHQYPDEWLVLGDWDQYGTPDYLLPELASPPAQTLYNIRETYSVIGDKYISIKHPELINGSATSEIKIVKPTKIYMTFIDSGANWYNTVGYFTYPTDNPPSSASEIKKIIAFPCSSPLVRSDKNRGALLCGNQILLKYWDGTKFLNEFPAGISIGWFLEGMAFDTNSANIKKNNFYARYSLSTLNSADGKQRVVALRDPDSKQLVSIGFEDSKDFNYSDATFYLNVEQEGAIDADMPDLPKADMPANKDNYTTYYGTLTYEDLWPSQGDYDMNDVMIDYNCKVYKTIIGNRIYKIIDEFTPRHNGGYLQSGFGYQFANLSPGDIRKITIENGVVSKYMEGQQLEPGQSHPTILLFDNVKDVIGKKITVTIELNDVFATSATPPYNPFIFVESNNGRGKEVHLPKYQPTDKADIALFGTGSDGSHPEEELYYVSSAADQYPFALNMANIKNFPTPEEGVRIDETYPKFKTWVSSKGEKEKSWYNYPKK